MHIRTRIFALVLLLCSIPAGAHHSRGSYDIDRTIELSGVVTQVSWRNPHVYISLRTDSSDDDSQPWILEGHSISGMLANGWNRNSVSVGDHVRAVINPGRATSRQSGLIDYIRRDAGGTFFAFRRPPEGGPADRPPDIEPSKDFSGNWAYRRPLRDVLLFRTPDFDAMPLNAAGKEQAKKFDPNANPAFDCKSPGLPRQILAAYAYRWIRSDDRIIIEKEQASRDDIRTIYLDGTTMPASFEPGPVGFSTGRFEQGGEILVVETVGFSATAWGLQPGVDSSPQKRLLERYRLTNGGLRMVVEYTVEDPAYLSAPLSGVGVYDKQADREFTWDPCDIEAARKHLQFEE